MCRSEDSSEEIRKDQEIRDRWRTLNLDIAIATEASRLKRHSAARFYNRGLESYNKDDLDGAIKDYTEAIRLKPDYADAFNNRGIARRAKGDLDGAIKDYTEAIGPRARLCRRLQ